MEVRNCLRLLELITSCGKVFHNLIVLDSIATQRLQVASFVVMHTYRMSIFCASNFKYISYRLLIVIAPCAYGTVQQSIYTIYAYAWQLYAHIVSRGRPQFAYGALSIACSIIAPREQGLHGTVHRVYWCRHFLSVIMQLIM